MGGLIMEKVNVNIGSDCVNIIPPTGFVIDEENSTLNCIKFKPIENKRWRDDEDAIMHGYYITMNSDIVKLSKQWNIPNAYSTFATEKQAKSALAMARISQIMANDERFGGVVTDEEWKNSDTCKYVICRESNRIVTDLWHNHYYFLAFHTAEQRDLFLKENEDLVRDYLML